MSVRGLWIEAKIVEKHCDLQYSVAWGCLSDAIGSKHDQSKNVVKPSVIYNIIDEGDGYHERKNFRDLIIICRRDTVAHMYATRCR